MRYLSGRTLPCLACVRLWDQSHTAGELLNGPALQQLGNVGYGPDTGRVYYRCCRRQHYSVLQARKVLIDKTNNGGSGDICGEDCLRVE